jgi:hypothetical protein
MSLGQEAYNSKNKRKSPEVEAVDEELKAALLLIQNLREKKQKVEAFDEIQIERTPARECIIKHFSLGGISQIFPLHVSGIIAEYHGPVNVHDNLVALLFRKKILEVANSILQSRSYQRKLLEIVERDIAIPDKGFTLNERLPTLISYEIGSFVSCGAYDFCLGRDDLKLPSCTELPEYICHRSHRAFCRKHVEVPKEYLLPDHLHVKHMCNGCWLACPCKNDSTSDIPINGGWLKGGSYRCAQCLVSICNNCAKSNRCVTTCPHAVLADTFSRGLCVNCGERSQKHCKKCLIDAALNPVFEALSP